MARYYSFEDSALPTVELAGGKGLSLLYSKKKGFNVPTAVVLLTKFFQPWMELLKASPEWKVFTQAIDDGTERVKRILAEAEDPSVAILMLDFIFGYNASNDPVGDLVEALQQAIVIRSKAGGKLTIVASVCGTSEDHQDIGLQIKMLKEWGAFVFQSNARAAAFCHELLDRS